MEIFISNIGRREFLVIEDVLALPIESIIKIDLNAENGVATPNSICILTTTGRHYLAYEIADQIREFLNQHKLLYLSDDNIDSPLEE